MMIDTTNWKEFRVGDILNCKTTKPLIETNPGTIPYVTRSAINNGVNDFIEQQDYKLNNGNCITIGAEGTIAFYQPDDFISGVKIYSLTHKSINQYNAIFLCTILNKNAYKYSYGRARILDKIKEEIIKLPATTDENGNIVPDWQYMEDYIKSLKISLPETKNISNNTNIKINTWQDFRIGDLFTISLSKGDIKQGEITQGNIPLISSGSVNNGVVDFIDENGDGIAKIFTKEKITVDMFGQAFYQPRNFFSVSHGRINVLSPKQEPFNKYIALFICTAINKEQYRFSYNRAVYSSVINNTIIKLPATTDENGNIVPDWNFMENYIKSLPYADLI